MPKRRLNKKLLLPVISIIIAGIIIIIGWNILKVTHTQSFEDVGMAIIFAITLIISCIAYLWIIFMSVGIMDIIDNNKKNR